MRSNMSKNNEQLVELIKDVVSGNKEKMYSAKSFIRKYMQLYILYLEKTARK
jgi:hypothetical protein